jgi:hypothetical protein
VCHVVEYPRVGVSDISSFERSTSVQKCCQYDAQGRARLWGWQSSWYLVGTRQLGHPSRLPTLLYLHQLRSPAQPQLNAAAVMTGFSRGRRGHFALLPLLLLTLLLAGPATASFGDKMPAFKKCVQVRAPKNQPSSAGNSIRPPHHSHWRTPTWQLTD